MIFVTVGTHEQQFNRLIKYMDEYAEKTNEIVVIQTGYSTYKCKFADSYDFLTMNEMDNYISSANVVITHGGPSSFLSVIQKHKKVIVVPRLEKFEEHVNNHQADFLKKISGKFRGIIYPVIDINYLADTIKEIKNSKKISNDEDSNVTNHNKAFNERLQEIVSSLMEGK